MIALVAAVPASAAEGDATCASAEHAGGDWPTANHDLHNTRRQDQEHVIGVGSAEPRGAATGRVLLDRSISTAPDPHTAGALDEVADARARHMTSPPATGRFAPVT